MRCHHGSQRTARCPHTRFPSSWCYINFPYEPSSCPRVRWTSGLGEYLSTSKWGLRMGKNSVYGKTFEGKKLHVFSQIIWRSGASLPGICSIIFADSYFCVMSSTPIERCYNKCSKKFIVVPVEGRLLWTFFCYYIPKCSLYENPQERFLCGLKPNNNFWKSSLSSSHFFIDISNAVTDYIFFSMSSTGKLRDNFVIHQWKGLKML